MQMHKPNSIDSANDRIKSLPELALEYPHDQMIQAGADRELYHLKEAAAKGHQPAIDFLAKLDTLQAKANR